MSGAVFCAGSPLRETAMVSFHCNRAELRSVRRCDCTPSYRASYRYHPGRVCWYLAARELSADTHHFFTALFPVYSGLHLPVFGYHLSVRLFSGDQCFHGGLRVWISCSA